MTREDIADGIDRFLSDPTTNGKTLARETRTGTDRLFVCEEDEAPWESSSRWDPLVCKSHSGVICPIGRIARYFDDGKFDRELYLNP